MTTQRPTITETLIREAARPVAEYIEGNLEDIVEQYQPHMDGFRLAKALDKHCLWDCSRDVMESLDEVDSNVQQLLRYAERQWFAENDIQPPLPIGTTIKEGVIDGFSEHSVATYQVKENGCTHDGRWLLVKFEDAEAV